MKKKELLLRQRIENLGLAIEKFSDNAYGLYDNGIPLATGTLTELDYYIQGVTFAIDLDNSTKAIFKAQVLNLIRDRRSKHLTSIVNELNYLAEVIDREEFDKNPF